MVSNDVNCNVCNMLFVTIVVSCCIFESVSPTKVLRHVKRKLQIRLRDLPQLASFHFAVMSTSSSGLIVPIYYFVDLAGVLNVD